MAIDVTTRTLRELIRGHMRGNRAELKLGYSPLNAARSVARLKVLPIRSEEFEALNSYAQGFSDGMRRCQTMASQDDTPSAETDAYCVGYVHGMIEDQMFTHPSNQAV